ncbi:MAG: mucoidy inhibitor MuiA family protein [Candidatus Thorarchaeota archaeon]
MVNPIKLDTKIKAVTIYRNGAKIERTGTIELKPGTHKIEIANLTRFLDKESVRVSGKGHATIVSFDTIDTTVEVSGYSKLDTLVKKREDLQKQQLRLQSEHERISQRMNFYSQVLEKSAGEFSKWIPAGESNVDQLSSLETLVTTQLNELHKQQISLSEELEKVQKEITIVTREIDKFRSEVSQYEISHSIFVNIDVYKLGNCAFNISYFVNNAYWTPTYDFVLSEETTEVTMYTVVQNSTQEDWEKVNLTVSTASRRTATITEPSPYFIQIYSPPPRRAMRMAKKEKLMAPAASGAAVDEAFEAEELAAMPEEPIPDMAPPPVTATAMEVGGVYVFVLPNPVKVVADGEPHAFLTSQLKLEADREFFWNAVDFAEAIEVTKVKNGASVLLPGKARIYYQDEYLGETDLDLIAPNEVVDVGMRFSYDLKVEKKLVEKSTEKKGLLKGNVARDYAYELTVKNYRKKVSTIKIMDRVPHSDSEIIKVDNRKFTPAPTKDELGILTWELEVPPEGETKITYSFQIEYPRGETITPPLP